MTTTPDPRQIAAGLTKAQRAFLSAASVKPKKWMTIRRHAKLANGTRVHGMVVPLRLITSDHDWLGHSLTPLGLAVRAILEGQNDG